jgi:hypothetical protein
LPPTRPAGFGESSSASFPPHRADSLGQSIRAGWQAPKEPQQISIIAESGGLEKTEDSDMSHSTEIVMAALAVAFVGFSTLCVLMGVGLVLLG